MGVYCVGHGQCLCSASNTSIRGRAETLENADEVSRGATTGIGADAQIEVQVRDAIIPTSAQGLLRRRERDRKCGQMAAAGWPVPKFGAAALTSRFPDVVPQIR